MGWIPESTRCMHHILVGGCGEGTGGIAWTGVSLTVSNIQRKDRIEEWHNDQRWAVELSTSGNEASVLTGTNVLAAIEDLPFLTPDQNAIIDAVL